MEMIYLIEFAPLIVMSLLCGFVRFARTESELINDNEDEKRAIKYKRTRTLRGIDIVLTSMISGFIIYACLSHFTDINYLVKIGISAAVALYGVDKMLDIVHRLWEIKKGG